MTPAERKAKLLLQLTELDHLGLAKIPADRIDGREFFSGGKRFIDYCTTNYLGFDFEEEMHAVGSRYAKAWGSLTGWSRLEADPVIYTDTEKRIAKLVGCRETILSHTITITNFSAIPAIVEKGVVIADEKVHSVVYEACRLARDHGATLARFKHQNLEDLERLLREHRDIHPKLIAVDGVYSISTEYAPIRELQALCRKYDAWLYVDDAHGFGVLGSEPDVVRPYGKGGAGIVARTGGDYDRTFYVSSFGKAFCTHTAFIGIPDAYRMPLRDRSLQYIYSAPMSPYVVGMVNASLDLNERIGDERRARLLALTRRFVARLRSMNLNISNNEGFPVVFWEIGSLEALATVAKHLYASGIVAGLRAYPIVPENGCGIRFGITALHTENQIDRALEVISECIQLRRTA